MLSFHRDKEISAIRLSVVPPDASEVLLMTSSFVNQSYIELAAADSDNLVCMGFEASIRTFLFAFVMCIALQNQQ